MLWHDPLPRYMNRDLMSADLSGSRRNNLKTYFVLLLAAFSATQAAGANSIFSIVAV